MHYPHRSIESYVHKHRIGVLVEFGMFSDFTSQVPEVKTFMLDMALHVAACAPGDLEDFLSQHYIKDPDKKIGSYLHEIQEFVSEEIAIVRFVRWEVGEDDGDSTSPPRSPANVVRFAQVK